MPIRTTRQPSYAKATDDTVHSSPLASVGLWTWYTPTRTVLRIPFNFRIYLGETHTYQALGAKAKALHEQGLSWVKIGKKLKISDKTAKKAAQNC